MQVVFASIFLRVFRVLGFENLNLTGLSSQIPILKVVGFSVIEEGGIFCPPRSVLRNLAGQRNLSYDTTSLYSQGVHERSKTKA